MKLIKMLGIAAVATVVFMATVGVGSAMAQTELEKVVWCAKREHACPAAQHYPAGTEIFATATSTEFLSDLGNVVCTASELLMTNTGLLVHGNVTALAFGGCSLGGTKCTITAEHLEYLFKGSLNNAHGYEIKITEKAPNGVPQATIVCGLFISCTYTFNEVSVAALLAFTPERLKILQTATASKGFLCPQNVVWHGTYNAQCRENEGSALKNCWVKMES